MPGVSRLWGSIDFDEPQPVLRLASSSRLSEPVIDGGVSSARTATSACESGLLTIAVDAELHNRPDLIRALAPHTTSSSKISDTELLVLAYEKWGEQCGSRLLGEFAFAIWDSRLRRVFCCRDHLGMRPFLYWRNSSFFIFAGDPRAILDVPEVPRELNRRKLAAMQVAGGRHFYPEETLHAGIMSLPSGASMTVERNGLRKWTYWEPEVSPAALPKRDDEIFTQLRELLCSAISCRIENRKSPGAFLSGGLDSSAVVAIAAHSLEKANRGMVALCSVLPEGSPAGLSDEREYIEEFRGWPNVDIQYVTAPGRGPFDDIEDETRFEASFTRSSRHFVYGAFQDEATLHGLDIVLDGVGGELGPTYWASEYLLELAAGFRWLRLAHELRSLRAVNGTSPMRALGGQLLETLCPNRRFRQPVLWNAEFLRGYEAPPASGGMHWPNHRRAHMDLLRQFRRRHANIHQLWPLEETRCSYPLLDKRIVEFCIAAPGRLKFRDGYHRYLVRGALDGILPRKIQWRTGKKPFSPDYYVRFNAQLGKARHFVAGIGARDPVRAVVDIERLRTSLEPVDPVTGSWEALTSIPHTIYLIAFLRQFAEFRK